MSDQESGEHRESLCELMVAGIQPEEENGKPLASANLQSRLGTHHLVVQTLRALLY